MQLCTSYPRILYIRIFYIIYFLYMYVRTLGYFPFQALMYVVFLQGYHKFLTLITPPHKLLYKYSYIVKQVHTVEYICNKDVALRTLHSGGRRPLRLNHLKISCLFSLPLLKLFLTYFKYFIKYFYTIYTIYLLLNVCMHLIVLLKTLLQAQNHYEGIIKTT